MAAARKRINDHEAGSRPGQRLKLLKRSEINIGREVDHIVARAEERSGRIVQLMELVLFSTEDGDAWMLDTDDRLALCLAKSGVRQPFKVFDTPDQFGIEWTADYRLKGRNFILEKRSGGTVTIRNFPRDVLTLLCRAPGPGL